MNTQNYHRADDPSALWSFTVSFSSLFTRLTQLYHFLLILSALCRFWLQQASVFSKNTETKSL